MVILASFGVVALSFTFVMVSLLLIGLILLQKNRGSGLSGAFGGVGGHSAFGTKTGDFLTWVTVGFTALFLLLAVVGNYLFEPGSVAKRSKLIDTNDSTPVTPAPVTPAPAPVTPAPAPVTPPPAATNPPAEAPSTPGTPAQPTPPAPSAAGESSSPSPVGDSSSTPPAGGATTPPPATGGEPTAPK